MGSFSVWHWLIVGIILLLLFGKGRFSEMMGDVAKGIKSFKKGMTEDDDAPHAVPPAATRQIDSPRAEPLPAHSDTVDPLAKPADRHSSGGIDGRSL